MPRPFSNENSGSPEAEKGFDRSANDERVGVDMGMIGGNFNQIGFE